MKKKLEEFVKENRPEFDTRKIDEKVWTRLDLYMKEKSRKTGILASPLFKWAAAAAALILITSSLFFFFSRNKEKKISIDSIVREQYPDYDTKISSFATLIENKKAAIKTIEKDLPGIYKQFIRDLTELKQNYEELRNELLINPNRNILLAQMIENLELQVRLLNKQINLIGELKEPATITDEKQYKDI